MLRCALTHCDSARLSTSSTIESTGAPEVEILDAGLTAQPSRLQVAMETAVLAVLGLAVDQHAQALFEGQRLVVGTFHLFAEGARHAHQVEGVKLVEGRRGEHGDLLLTGSRWRRARSRAGGPGWPAATSAKAGGRARS